MSRAQKKRYSAPKTVAGALSYISGRMQVTMIGNIVDKLGDVCENQLVVVEVANELVSVFLNRMLISEFPSPGPLNTKSTAVLESMKDLFARRPFAAFKGVFKESSFTPSKRPSKCPQAVKLISESKDHAFEYFGRNVVLCSKWFAFLAVSLVENKSPQSQRRLCDYMDQIFPPQQTEEEAIDTDELYSLDLDFESACLL